MIVQPLPESKSKWQSVLPFVIIMFCNAIGVALKIFHHCNVIIVRRVVFRIKLFIIVYIINILIFRIYVLLGIFRIFYIIDAIIDAKFLKICIALIVLPVPLLSWDEIRCWFWCPISILTAMLRVLSGCFVSRRSSRWMSSSNILVMKMSLIITSSRLSKSQFTANSFKSL